LKKAVAVLLLIVVSAFAFAAVNAQDDVRVALIIAQGGLGDRSYNDSAFAGLTLAAAELGVDVVPIESPDVVTDGENILRTAAEAGFDLVITLEFAHLDPLPRIAPDYPDTTFAIVNTIVDAPNVASIMFDEHTGSYLAGTLAALMTTDENIEQTNPEAVIGTIGGVQSSGIDVFLYGYLQGACAVNPDIEVLFAYAGTFGDPEVGRELTVAMNEQGADVVFGVAGGTGAGIIDAAAEGDYFAVGVDSDQDFLAPGNVLTSMLKRVDVAVFDTINQYVAGEAIGGTVLQYGLTEEGVGLSEMIYTRQLIPGEYMDAVEAAREGILSGEIEVIDIRELSEEEFAIVQENPTCAGMDELSSMIMES